MEAFALLMSYTWVALLVVSVFFAPRSPTVRK
jgi:hypothetical protein